MTTPKPAIRELDKYKRQLKLLEMYLTGRMSQLRNIAQKRPAEQSACEMAETELSLILTQVLPQMQEVQS